MKLDSTHRVDTQHAAEMLASSHRMGLALRESTGIASASPTSLEAVAQILIAGTPSDRDPTPGTGHSSNCRRPVTSPATVRLARNHIDGPDGHHAGMQPAPEGSFLPDLQRHPRSHGSVPAPSARVAHVRLGGMMWLVLPTPVVLPIGADVGG